MRNIRMTLLHPNYHMDMYRLDSNEVNVEFNDYFDHFNFSTKIKDIVLFDLTGYPYTLDPKISYPIQRDIHLKDKKW